MFLFSKKKTVSRYSSVGIVVNFPLTMFHFLPMRLLPLQIRNRAKCIGLRLRILVKVVFCRLSQQPKVQFPQKAVQTDDARTTTVPSQRLLFLHDICSFSSLQLATRKNTGVIEVTVLSVMSVSK